MGNIPILFLSAFKNSPIGYISGLSYEKINSFHRWVGRLIVATFLTHGILMGILMVKRQGVPFSMWIARRDVQWGISAISCLLLLFLLYTLMLMGANVVRIVGREPGFMSYSDGLMSSLLWHFCSAHIIINLRRCILSLSPSVSSV